MGAKGSLSNLPEPFDILYLTPSIVRIYNINIKLVKITRMLEHGDERRKIFYMCLPLVAKLSYNLNIN